MEEGKEQIYHYLHEIIEAFRGMDDILQEINQKNTQYQRAAINRAKFLLAGNEDVRGQLKELLIGINEEINRENRIFPEFTELIFWRIWCGSISALFWKTILYIWQ